MVDAHGWRARCNPTRPTRPSFPKLGRWPYSSKTSPAGRFDPKWRPPRFFWGVLRPPPVRVRSSRALSVRHTRSHSLMAHARITQSNKKGVVSVWVALYLPRIILRPAPMFWPAWEAPLFCPACRPMMVLPAARVSSLKSLLASSAGLGPSLGPVHSGWR